MKLDSQNRECRKRCNTLVKSSYPLVTTEDVSNPDFPERQDGSNITSDWIGPVTIKRQTGKT